MTARWAGLEMKRSPLQIRPETVRLASFLSESAWARSRLSQGKRVFRKDQFLLR